MRNKLLTLTAITLISLTACEEEQTTSKQPMPQKKETAVEKIIETETEEETTLGNQEEIIAEDEEITQPVNEIKTTPAQIIEAETETTIAAETEEEITLVNQEETISTAETIVEDTIAEDTIIEDTSEPEPNYIDPSTATDATYTETKSTFIPVPVIDEETQSDKELFNDEGIVIKNAYAFATSEKQKNGAIFATINNNSNVDDELISMTFFDGVNRVELHSNEDNNGTMSMQKVESIAIKKDTSFQLKPMGYHVMLIGLETPLVKDQTLSVEFNFNNTGSIPAEVKVIAPGTKFEPTE